VNARSWIVVVALVLLASSCGSDDTRPQAVAGVVDSVIVPAYEANAERLGELAVAADALCERPSPEALASAQARWRSARLAWRRTEPYWFGPVMTRRSETVIDWPADEKGVERILGAGWLSITPRDLLGESAGVRGLGAAEILLFGPGHEPLARGLDPQRCRYVRATAQAAAAEARGLRDDWTTGSADKEPYADVLAGRSEGITSREAIEMIVERHVLLLNRMVDRELGRLVEPSTAESALAEGPAGNGAAQIAARLEAVRAAYAGSEQSPRLGEALSAVSEGARERLLERLDRALAAARSIRVPLRSPQGTNELETSGLYQATKDVEETLSTELVSLFGVTVGFSDNDGDSG
jgi:predicted lipoprotein